MQFKKSLAFVIMASSLSTIFFFQNCGQVAYSPLPEQATTQLSSSDVVIPSDPHLYISKVQVNPLVANRVLTTNIFTSIFGPTITPIASSNMGKNSTDFGSGFSAYDRVISATCAKDRDPYTLCATADVMDMSAPSNVSLNIRREAWRIRTCHAAVSSDVMLLFALKKISSIATIAKPPAVTPDTSLAAFRLFFRSKPLPDEQLIDSLAVVADQESNSANKWRSLLLTLCLSPHWQVL